MKVPIDLIEKARAAWNVSDKTIQTIRKRISTASALALDGQEHVERRKQMIAAVAAEPVADAFERYIGENELLPINYLAIGLQQSRAVGCIRYFDKSEGKGAVATGFLISEELLVTNHHVFPVDDVAQFRGLVKDPTVEFNFEFDIDGTRPAAIAFELDPDRFLHTWKDLDLAVVAVRPTDKSGKHALRNQGYLVLNGARGKAGKGDSATIIQHPGGSEKQIAIRKNEIINVDLDDAIIYVSDTARGSSGAPVFNDQWQVIALHSAGVAKKDAAGHYIDKDDQIIQPIGDRIDEDRIVWESNRGIRVSTIMNHLSTHPAVVTHPAVQALLSPAYTDSRPFAFLSRPASDVERTIVAPVVEPAAPARAVAPISININISPTGGVPAITTSALGFTASPLTEAFVFEKKFEDELDFSNCAGFETDFMGVYLPMPTPSEDLRRKLAYLKNSPSAFTLKYHHFSAIHHAVRRVPVVVGLNVHSKWRYPELDEDGSRQDKWFRDNRIDYDVQLNDDFYAKSGFDKGHMARREDVEWGRTLARAKLAADMSCSYVNAAPQVPTLNRARFGLRGKWGLLEEELLEKGIELEEGKAGRICVFAGPLFNDDEDPVFKGVQVAMRFFKVVCWYDGDGELRTTCYRLSQERLVGDIAFEVLRFDEIFTTAQVPLAYIEKITGLKFHSSIADIDTNAGGEMPDD